MKNFLLSISLLFCTLQCMAQKHFYPSEDGGRNDYATAITFRGSTISGICIVRRSGNEVIGSIVNEFGVKMLDFVYDIGRSKVQCRNIMGMMDKWYIRKTLKADLKFLLSNTGSETPVETSDRTMSITGEIWSLVNTDPGISYIFSPIIVDRYETAQ